MIYGDSLNHTHAKTDKPFISDHKSFYYIVRAEQGEGQSIRMSFVYCSCFFNGCLVMS